VTGARRFGGGVHGVSCSGYSSRCVLRVIIKCLKQLAAMRVVRQVAREGAAWLAVSYSRMPGVGEGSIHCHSKD
jgi:hypothetical protein